MKSAIKSSLLFTLIIFVVGCAYHSDGSSDTTQQYYKEWHDGDYILVLEDELQNDYEHIVFDYFHAIFFGDFDTITSIFYQKHPLNTDELKHNFFDLNRRYESITIHEIETFSDPDDQVYRDITQLGQAYKDIEDLGVENLKIVQIQYSQILTDEYAARGPSNSDGHYVYNVITGSLDGQLKIMSMYDPALFRVLFYRATNIESK